MAKFLYIPNDCVKLF